MKKTAEQRLIEKTDKQPNGCWIWKGAGQKYGNFYIEGRYEKSHRASWIIFRGPISSGLCVCHQCDNPKCVNPDHLFLGSQADNIRDQIQKGHNCRGSMSHHAKLTPREVMAIRKLYSFGRLNQYELASAFSVRQTHISRIVNHQKWKDVL